MTLRKEILIKKDPKVEQTKVMIETMDAEFSQALFLFFFLTVILGKDFLSEFILLMF